MRKQRSLQSQKGLTLVEVLAALVILGIFFVGFMTVLPQMTNFNAKTEDKLKTMNLAKKELVEWKNRTYNLGDFEGPDYTEEVVDGKAVKRDKEEKMDIFMRLTFMKIQTLNHLEAKATIYIKFISK